MALLKTETLLLQKKWPLFFLCSAFSNIISSRSINKHTSLLFLFVCFTLPGLETNPKFILYINFYDLHILHMPCPIPCPWQDRQHWRMAERQWLLGDEHKRTRLLLCLLWELDLSSHRDVYTWLLRKDLILLQVLTNYIQKITNSTLILSSREEGNWPSQCPFPNRAGPMHITTHDLGFAMTGVT